MRRREKLELAHVELRWRRYRDSPADFFSECLQIPTLGEDAGRTRFVPFDYQLDTLETWVTNRFVLVLKARQLGLTTLAMAYALHQLVFRPGSNVLLVSKDQRTANKALGLLDFMWGFLPEWVAARAPKLEVDNATEHVWRFRDGMTSRIVSLPATATAGAGETATLVLWDEAGLAPSQDDTLRTLKPTTDAGGRMIVFSTARGANNMFARMWREAERGESQFVPVFHPWSVSRLIDQYDYEQKRKDFKDQPWRFAAEYPSTPAEAFKESGRTRFPDLPPDDVLVESWRRGWLAEDGFGSFRFVEDESGPLRIRPSIATGAPPYARSVVSVDPATGTGGDYTAMQAGWMTPDGVPFRAAWWHANDIESLEAARQADMLGRWMAGADRAALLVVEKAGGYGETFLHELRANLHYPNMYVHRRTTHRKRQAEQTFGFPMSWSRRPLVIDRLAEWVRFTDGSMLDGIDGLLRTELSQFVVTDNGRVQADTGCYDDLVMSAAIWLWVLTEQVGVSTDATPVTTVDGKVQTFSIGYVFEEADRKRQLAERQGRRELRRLSRSGRRR